MANKEKFVELMRLTSDLIKYAIDESSTNIDNAICYLRKAVMLNNDARKNDTINIIFMNINKYMSVTREQIQCDASRTDENKYSKMFVYVLFNRAALISQYTIARYFDVNRSTILRYCNDFKKLEREPYRTMEQERYMRKYNTIYQSVISDMKILNDAKASTEQILKEGKKTDNN
jgi:hypothetical protein